MDKVKKIKAHFNAVDSKIAPIVDAMELVALTGESDHARYFENLCKDIIAQQLAGKAAEAILDRFTSQFPRRRATPRRVLAMHERELRNIGMSWAKVRYIRDLAERVGHGELNLKGIADMQDADVVAELTKVKGIGAWTAEMFLIFTLGREDVFSHGDLGLRKGLNKLYGARRNKERIVERWSPYKSYGCLALWHMYDV